MSLAARRRAASYLEAQHGVSERRACRVRALHRSSKRRRPGTLEQTELVTRLHELSERYPRFGYRKVYARLKTESGGLALFSSRGAPACIKCDNGSELIARQVTDWLRERGTDTYFIEPGSPWQNGHNESFNSVFRDGCLDRWAFGNPPLK